MRVLLVTLLTVSSLSAEIIGLETKSLRSGNELEPSTRPLRLIIMRFCPWCERVLIVIARKNMSVEVVNVSLSDKPKFLLEKHPDGRVPVLMHNNKTIIDSAVIAEYLDTLDPAKPILPTDPDLRSKQKKMAAKLEAQLPSAVHALINEQRFHTEKEPTIKKLHDALDLAEKLLPNSTFYAGREPGFADYMTYPFVERIWIWSHEPGVTDLPADGFPGASYPKLQRWFSLMRSTAEVKAVSQPVWRHRMFNQGYVHGNPDYDAGMGIRRHD
ncbi:hypothetical protein V3C99_001285 [Haemonchus contortus]|nr:Glutathione S-transferase domain containing protein [Haemonchus contortus]